MSLFYRLLRRPKALDPVRREASRYLRRLQAKGLDSGVRAELEALRFGPSIDARAAKPIFIRARRVLRQRS